VRPACPKCHLCRCTAFPAKLQFKFGQPGKHYGAQAACGVDVSMASRSDRTAWVASTKVVYESGLIVRSGVS
jgi:hypothetical protein